MRTPGNPVRNTLLAAFTCAALATGVASAQDPPPPRPPVLPPEAALGHAGTDVVLTTDDGMKIAATSWSGGAANAPGAVLLHMYRSERSAWAPLVPHLRDRRMNVIAIDLRGHGDSAKQGRTDLAPRVEKRDPKVFAEMHRDAIAAVRWLVKEGRCDPKRIALVGASVGCSVAIDTARRHAGETAAVVCMTAGEKYLGLDSLTHAKAWPAAEPLLLLTHAEEADVGSKALHDAIPGSRLVVYDDAPSADARDQEGWAHGTRMFGRMPLVERTVASFVAARTGSATDDVVLDGIVVADGPDADPWSKATDVAGEGGGKAWAYRVGRRVVFGGIAPAACKAVRVWTESGTIPLPKGAPAGVPKIGLPRCAAIDVATGHVLWTDPPSSSTPEMPEIPDALAARFGAYLPMPPAVRVVRSATGATFEGEWSAPPAAVGAADDGVVRVSIQFDSTVPAEPPRDRIRLEAPPGDRREVPSR